MLANLDLSTSDEDDFMEEDEDDMDML